MTPLPKRGTSGTENAGLGILTEIVSRDPDQGGLGFVFRPQPIADVGIDGLIEVVDQFTDEVTGRLVGVQLKTGPSFFRTSSADGWVVPIRKATVDYWRVFSLPVVLVLVNVKDRIAFWAVASEGEFEATNASYKIVVPKKQILNAGAADAIAALALRPSAAVREQLERLTRELSEAIAADLEQFREEWREALRAGARGWLADLLATRATLATLDPAVAGQVVRWAASVALDDGEDLQVVRARVDEARRIDPTGDDARIRAALLLRDHDVDSALAVLEASADPSSNAMRASILYNFGRLDEATEAIDGSIPGNRFDAVDTCLIRARLSFAAGDVGGALDAVAEAETYGPRYVQVRLLRAALHYLAALVPDAVPDGVPVWPQPVSELFIRQDAEALGHLRSAAVVFDELLQVELSPAELPFVEAWRVAVLSALPDERVAATEAALGALQRDPAQRYVLLWVAHQDLDIEIEPNLRALETEIAETDDIGGALAYIALRAGTGVTGGLLKWLESWRTRFQKAGALQEWTYWYARVLLADGRVDEARELLPDLSRDRATAIEAEALAAEVRGGADVAALTAYLEDAAKSSDNPQLLFEACREYARAGKWDAIVPHVNELLRRLPTPPVRDLALRARYETADFGGCVALLDDALNDSVDADTVQRLRRRRAEMRIRAGNVSGAVDDMQSVTARAQDQPLTSDLLLLARAQFLAGNAHELATTARRLRAHIDLSATDALMLCEMLVHDDSALARDLWRIAHKRDIAESNVPNAVALGFQLNLDDELGPLLGRMAALAAEGKAGVQQFTLDELIAQNAEWLSERARLLDLYRSGNVPSHVVARALNIPLTQLYHFLLISDATGDSVRKRFPLQMRDGSRGLPSEDAKIASAGRLAMDLSALLLSAHLGVISEVERAFGPVWLPHLTLVALAEERDKLRPHQPSQLDVVQQLLSAERQRKIRTWGGALPELVPAERERAGNWADWIALLTRARDEGAFVLDLPLEGDSPHGRPASLAGAERLGRMVTVSDVRAVLEAVSEGPHRPERSPRSARNSEPARDGAPQPEPRPEPGPLRRGGALTIGDTIYLTDAGAEALAAEGCIDSAANAFTLLVRQQDQDARRQVADTLPEIEARVRWVESLMRRVSDGLADGRYTLLPETSAERRHDIRAAAPSAAAASVDDPSPGLGVVEAQAQLEAPEALDVETSTRGAVGSPGGGDDRGTNSPASAPRGHEWGGEEAHAIDADSAGVTEAAGRQLPLVLRCLAGLMSAPAELVDVVWVDDRWSNRFRFAGSSRMTDILEILRALQASGEMSEARRWQAVLDLRAANARIIPWDVDELLYHLRRAPVSDGEVVETRALRILRQHAASLLLDASSLRIPDQSAVAQGETGDLEVVRGYTSAVRAALVGLWQPEGKGASLNLDEVTARSAWLVSNLHVDIAILRSLAVPSGGPPDTGMSAFDIALLLTSAVQLLGKMNGNQSPPDDSVAAEYTNWVYNALAANRVRYDPAFRSALLTHLQGVFGNWTGLDSDDAAIRAVARYLGGRTFAAMPSEIRDVLAADDALAASVGRTVIASVNVGPWQTPLEEFASAVAAALSRKSPKKSV